MCTIKVFPFTVLSTVITFVFNLLVTVVSFVLFQFVFVSFWGIFAIDRELVYPLEMDNHIPVLLNHFWVSDIQGITNCLQLQFWALASMICSKHRFSIIYECTHVFPTNSIKLRKEGMLDRHALRYPGRTLMCVSDHRYSVLHSVQSIYEVADVSTVWLHVRKLLDLMFVSVNETQ